MTCRVDPEDRTGRVPDVIGAGTMGVLDAGSGIYADNPEAYGHSGWGGSFRCADPGAQVAIGYVCNRMGPELVGDPRTTGLCAAILGSAKTL